MKFQHYHPYHKVSAVITIMITMIISVFAGAIISVISSVIVSIIVSILIARLLIIAISNVSNRIKSVISFMLLQIRMNTYAAYVDDEYFHNCA